MLVLERGRKGNTKFFVCGSIDSAKIFVGEFCGGEGKLSGFGLGISEWNAKYGFIKLNENDQK